MAKPTPASPWEYQLDQPLLAAVCHICHRAPSLPMVKTSRRPSASCAIVMEPVKPTPAVPAEFQPDQPALGAVCQRCHRVPGGHQRLNLWSGYMLVCLSSLQVDLK